MRCPTKHGFRIKGVPSRLLEARALYRPSSAADQRLLGKPRHKYTLFLIIEKQKARQRVLPAPDVDQGAARRSSYRRRVRRRRNQSQSG